MFQHIPEFVNRFLAPPDPVVLHYTLNPGSPPPERPSAWDIEVKTEDVVMKNRMTTMVLASKESSQELTKLDDEVIAACLLCTVRGIDLSFSDRPTYAVPT